MKDDEKKKNDENMKECQTSLEKEIDLIQGCINRMAQNSFVIKGWLITLVTAVLALLPDKVNIIVLCVLLLFAIVLFWYLDAFFLKTERLYRMKYAWVIEKRKSTDEFKYDLDPYNKLMRLQKKDENGELKDQTEPTIWEVMKTKTLVPLYGALAALVIIVLLISCFGFFNLANTPQCQNDLQINLFSVIEK